MGTEITFEFSVSAALNTSYICTKMLASNIFFFKSVKYKTSYIYLQMGILFNKCRITKNVICDCTNVITPHRIPVESLEYY